MHEVFLGDCSVHLVLTSPPYWNIARYPGSPGQLGHIGDYGDFLAELEKALGECFRVLAPGGRLCLVVGDVCLSRRGGIGLNATSLLKALSRYQIAVSIFPAR